MLCIKRASGRRRPACCTVHVSTVAGRGRALVAHQKPCLCLSGSALLSLLLLLLLFHGASTAQCDPPTHMHNRQMASEPKGMVACSVPIPHRERGEFSSLLRLFWEAYELRPSLSMSVYLSLPLSPSLFLTRLSSLALCKVLMPISSFLFPAFLSLPTRSLSPSFFFDLARPF